MERDIFMSSQQIAETLKIRRRDVGKYVREYKLPAFQEKPGGKWKAREDSLQTWAAEHEKRFIVI